MPHANHYGSLFLQLLQHTFWEQEVLIPARFCGV